jgi:hypothetical protein
MQRKSDAHRSSRKASRSDPEEAAVVIAEALAQWTPRCHRHALTPIVGRRGGGATWEYYHDFLPHAPIHAASAAASGAAFTARLCGVASAQGAKRIEQFAPELDKIIGTDKSINQLADGVGGMQCSNPQ